jgi:glycosyltransferase involved in cell wall biosynthesis
MKKDLSVIVPFYNEEGNLPRLHIELTQVLSDFDIESEIVYINDGSRDDSEIILKKEINKNKEEKVEIKLISLKKNFGQTPAVSAGIDNSQGKYVFFLDADLQNDPGDIPRFVKKVNEGYDAVFGWRKERKDTTLRSIFSRVANIIIQKFFSFPFNDVGCSARIVKKEILEDIKLYGEFHRILPVLIYLKGAKIGEIVVKHRERYKGKSHYGYKRIIKVLIDMITVKFLHSYGTRPAYVFGTLGFGSISFGILTLLAVAYRKLFLGVFVHKDPLFLIAIFLGLLGVQFILMGLIAELQVRTYFESQNKPIYDVEEILKF